jgi:hypothetical protein
MLFLIPRIPKHKAYRLNKHVKLFFRRLSTVNNLSNFNPITNYFHPEFVTLLNRADQTELRSHFENFFEAFKVLPQGQRDIVISRFGDSQALSKIFNDVAINGNDFKVNAMPQSLRVSARALFGYLYKTTLKSFGGIKDHYKKTYAKLDSKTCPFCGIEKLNAPSLRKQDYDHILNQAKYAYTSVNIENLVPMGTECNRNFKGSTDVLYDGAARVLYYSPYEHSNAITISLNGSTPPNDIEGAGAWQVTLNPNNNVTRNWDRVFKIKKRYAETMLNGFYKEWIKEFRNYYKVHGIPNDANDLKVRLNELGGILLGSPLSDPNIVKGALYQFLSNYNDPIYEAAVLGFVSN